MFRKAHSRVLNFPCSDISPLQPAQVVMVEINHLTRRSRAGFDELCFLHLSKGLIFKLRWAMVLIINTEFFD